MFTTRSFKKGETVCLYSGKILDSAHARKSKYMIEATHEGRKKFLDGEGVDNEPGSLINDACDLYESVEDFPSTLVSPYYTNVGKYVQSMFAAYKFI